MKGKKYVAALLGLALMVTGVRTAKATANSDNNADSLTITILPNIDRGVSIDTTAAYMDLGTMDLKLTTRTVHPATVTILGTLASDGSQTSGQELDLSLTFTGGWSLDTAPTIDTTGVGGEVDALAVYALFSDTGLSTVPTAAEFVSDNGAFTTMSARAGGGSGDGTQFEKTGLGVLPVDGMDHKNPQEKAHLWMLLRMPSATTSGGSKTVTLTATAVDAT